MDEQLTRQEIDQILLPFLRATDSAEAEYLLTQLVSECVEPVAKTGIGYKMRAFVGRNRGVQDADDVCSEVIVRLTGRLQELRNDPGAKPIASFRGYVKVVAVNACSEYLRKKYPRRSGLQDKLRYLLTHRPGLAIWKSKEQDWFCGFTRWRDQTKMPSRSAWLEKLRDNPKAVAQAALPHRDLHKAQLPDLLDALFTWTDSPIGLDDLVSVIAELQGINDHVAQPVIRDSRTSQPIELEIRDPRAGADVELSQRLELQRLWAEICLLPPRQRFALLMNLRDDQGQDVTGLLPLTGVCAFSEIAEALSLTVERLAELAKDLPLDDAGIAKHLGLTRQQVINLRKSARERLARRLRNFDK